jgi:hypothetical protein
VFIDRIDPKVLECDDAEVPDDAQQATLRAFGDLLPRDTGQ